MERDWIAHLRETNPRSDENLLLGIGDDATVLKTLQYPTVMTVDLLTEGVDFLIAEAEPELIGRKAVAVNLSDLAAMAAVPLAVLVAVALPKNDATELVQRLYAGMKPLLEKYDVSMAGGDTNTWDGGLVISVTAIGRLTQRGPLRRDGAKPDDRILVTGPLGGSILGRHFTFEPRIRESLFLHENYELHAGMDISDGLLLDLSRMAEASGLGAETFEGEIPIHPDAFRMNKPGVSPLEHALSDGEDFELILALPPSEAARLLADRPLDSTTLHEIGRFTEEPGVRMISKNGTMVPCDPRGFLH